MRPSIYSLPIVFNINARMHLHKPNSFLLFGSGYKCEFETITKLNRTHSIISKMLFIGGAIRFLSISFDMLAVRIIKSILQCIDDWLGSYSVRIINHQYQFVNRQLTKQRKRCAFCVCVCVSVALEPQSKSIVINRINYIFECGFWVSSKNNTNNSWRINEQKI